MSVAGNGNLQVGMAQPSRHPDVMVSVAEKHAVFHVRAVLESGAGISSIPEKARHVPRIEPAGGSNPHTIGRSIWFCPSHER